MRKREEVDELDEELRIPSEEAERVFLVIDALLRRAKEAPPAEDNFWAYLVWEAVAGVLPFWHRFEMSDEIDDAYRLRLERLIEEGERFLEPLRGLDDDELARRGVSPYRENVLDALKSHHKLLYEPRTPLDPETEALLDEIFNAPAY
ncbi:MAG: hypothetical protein PHO89_01150 [Methylacidiphilaceae bacterium]|nr:hypothetical protein [Candidatus Methylacidiphilaceae bacterium]